MHERLPTKGFVVPIEAYERLRERFSDDQLQRAYVGRWPDRTAFGEHLLRDTNAVGHIATLPVWLREYIRVDYGGFVHDRERDGMYVIHELQSEIVVFDGFHLQLHA